MTPRENTPVDRQRAGQAIRDARTNAGLSTKEAAALIGVTQRTWQWWESGDRTMKKPMRRLFNQELAARNTAKIAEE